MKNFQKNSKVLIALIFDMALCVVCTWLAFVIRLDELIIFSDFQHYLSLMSVILALPIFWIFGLYRIIFRHSGQSTIFIILSSNLIYGFFYFLIIGVFGFSNVPRSIGIIQPMLLFFAILSSRIVIKFFLEKFFSEIISVNKKNILIYGAGVAGRQLGIALENSPEYRLSGFLDDNYLLQGRVLLGQNVYSPQKIKDLIHSKNINLIFLALPAVERRKRNQIIQNLNKLKINIKTLPSISEIVDGKISISDIKDLNIDDLLSREEVIADTALLNKNINSKVVLVTGAGGSIGSELSRQIIRFNPRILLLLEMNEFALYKIHDEIKALTKKIKIIPLLINVQDQLKVELVFSTFKVDTVYHAAAYKHVPLVEENICEGVKNNVFSTLAIAQSVISCKVSSLVFISSDKAVRPTNIMGASKRLSELCIQGIYNNTENILANFSIVRFGNVLESSGSVIPKFKRQIKEGGPVTLTHEKITRYFMTATEAAQLVIQAGAMGNCAEVFVLDMGKSIKIKDLINKMINLSGLSIKDQDNPYGDIEIKITGLRPGEKLYEELLIGENPQSTSHPKIQKINDPYIPFDKLELELVKLKNLINKNKSKEVKNLLENIIKSFNSNSPIVDHIHVEQNHSSIN